MAVDGCKDRDDPAARDEAHRGAILAPLRPWRKW
jgi:hypothetical protein